MGPKARQDCKEKKIGCEDEHDPIEGEVLLTQETGDNGRAQSLVGDRE